ncbi:MAG: DMT family transporter [Myxococcota bacterium]
MRLHSQSQFEPLRSSPSRSTSTSRPFRWPHYFLGGLIVAFYVFSVTFVAPRLGVGNALVLVLLGQMLASAIIDHCGWWGTKQASSFATRGIGLLFIFGGVALTRSSVAIE